MRKDQGNYKTVSLASVSGKVMEITLGPIKRHLKNEAIVRDSQHELTINQCFNSSASFLQHFYQ